jgi:hypothetical protein
MVCACNGRAGDAPSREAPAQPLQTRDLIRQCRGREAGVKGGVG